MFTITFNCLPGLWVHQSVLSSLYLPLSGEEMTRWGEGRRQERKECPSCMVSTGPFLGICSSVITCTHNNNTVRYKLLSSLGKWGPWDWQATCPSHSRQCISQPAAPASQRPGLTCLLSYLQVNLTSLASVSLSVKWANNSLISPWKEEWDYIAEGFPMESGSVHSIFIIIFILPCPTIAFGSYMSVDFLQF